MIEPVNTRAERTAKMRSRCCLSATGEVTSVCCQIAMKNRIIEQARLRTQLYAGTEGLRAWAGSGKWVRVFMLIPVFGPKFGPSVVTLRPRYRRALRLSPFGNAARGKRIMAKALHGN